MTPKQLAEILAIIDKIKIESDPYLTKTEKEALKQLFYYAKDQIK